MAAPKSKQPRNERAPSLDDPRWVSLKLAHHIRSEQLVGARYSDLATPDLIEALESEELHSMRRNGANPSEREELHGSFWRGRRIMIIDQTLQIYGGQDTPRDPGSRVPWEFFVWKPDIDRLWPAPKAEQEIQESFPRRKPGRKPTENWQAFVLGALAVFVKEGKQVPPASDFAQLCEDELSYQPDLREIQKLIRQRLG